MTQTTHIVLVPNESLDPALEAARELIQSEELKGQYFSVATQEAADLLGLPLHTEIEVDPTLIVAFGGDGTILRAARTMKSRPAPLLGINYGRLGFLSGATTEDSIQAVVKALNGEVTVEARNIVEVRARTQNEFIEVGAALNEVVIGRGFGQPAVTTSLSINNHEIYVSNGDGLIVSTATGSTAYALSAGGPIMSPAFDGLVVVTLASHTLVQRALVTGHDDVVTVAFPDEKRAHIELVLDGVQVKTPNDLLAIECRVSKKTIELIKLDHRLFYDTIAAEFFSKKARS